MANWKKPRVSFVCGWEPCSKTFTLQRSEAKRRLERSHTALCCSRECMYNLRAKNHMERQLHARVC